jgi:hypothetical protein
MPGTSDGDGGAGTGGAGSGDGSSGGASSGGAASGGTNGEGSGGTALLGCPDHSVPIQYPSCRTSADCATNGGGQCFQDPPDVSGVCGICMPSATNCTTDAECGNDFICITEPPDRCQCMGGDRVCVPACTETSCGEGAYCGVSGRCLPESCADGFECSSDKVCAPERVGADEHGCALPSCEADGFVCPESTICDPARAGTTSQGCAPSSCETDGYACPAGRVCDPGGDAVVDVHGCRVGTCAEGFVCPVDSECNPNGPGCIANPCTTDTDCECAYCISGSCYSGPLGTCVVLPA